MSLESNLEILNKNLETLNKALNDIIKQGVSNTPQESKKIPEVVVPTETKVSTPVMPEAPFKTGIKVEPQVVATPKAPFTDIAGLTAYVIQIHTETEGKKVQDIQDTLESFGVVNLNDVNPKDFDAMYVKFEELRVK